MHSDEQHLDYHIRNNSCWFIIPWTNEYIYLFPRLKVLRKSCCQKISHLLWNTKVPSVFTRARQLSVSWAKLNKPNPSYLITFWFGLTFCYAILSYPSDRLLPVSFLISPTRFMSPPVSRSSISTALNQLIAWLSQKCVEGMILSVSFQRTMI
jgi:hypothetical protein